MYHTRNQGGEALPVTAIRCSQGQGSQGSPVESAGKRYNVRPTCMVACDLERSLYTLCSGVSEIRTVAATKLLVEALSQGNRRFVGKIREAHMREGTRLAAHGFHHPGVGVPGGVHSDTSHEIQEGVSVHILHKHSLARLGHKSIRATVC